MESENKKQKLEGPITERTDITARYGLDKNIRITNRKNTISREQPIREGEDHKQISGFIRKQQEDKRYRYK